MNGTRGRIAYPRLRKNRARRPLDQHDANVRTCSHQGSKIRLDCEQELNTDVVKQLSIYHATPLTLFLFENIVLFRFRLSELQYRDLPNDVKVTYRNWAQGLSLAHSVNKPQTTTTTASKRIPQKIAHHH